MNRSDAGRLGYQEREARRRATEAKANWGRTAKARQTFRNTHLGTKEQASQWGRRLNQRRADKARLATCLAHFREILERYADVCRWALGKYGPGADLERVAHADFYQVASSIRIRAEVILEGLAEDERKGTLDWVKLGAMVFWWKELIDSLPISDQFEALRYRQESHNRQVLAHVRFLLDVYRKYILGAIPTYHVYTEWDSVYPQLLICRFRDLPIGDAADGLVDNTPWFAVNRTDALDMAHTSIRHHTGLKSGDYWLTLLGDINGGTPTRSIRGGAWPNS